MIDEHVIRVLVVDDSHTQALAVARTLRAAGFAVETAHDAATALGILGQAEFELVLSDVQMPGLSGYELCRAVKALPNTRDVPVVLMTALSKPLDVIRGLECGADNYIAKPVQAETLLDRLRATLAERGRRAEAQPRAGDDVLVLGQHLSITASKEHVLDFLASAFEDLSLARQRVHESALERERQTAQTRADHLQEQFLRRENEALLQVQRFLQATLDALAARIAILDESGTILALNATWRQLTEVDPLTGVNCAAGTNYVRSCRAAPAGHAAEAAAIAAGIRDVSKHRAPEFAREYACEGPNGRRWFSIRVTRLGGARPAQVVIAHEEITRRKAAEERLRYEALHDALTGLPNRTLFAERLEQAIAQVGKTGGFAVILLDLDDFKVVNDSLGHLAGDRLLTAVARRLKAVSRSGDTVARLGGDEFALLALEIHDEDHAWKLAERYLRELEPPIPLDGHEVREVRVMASVGIALSSAVPGRPEDYLRDADTALYRAKATGKSRHVVFDRAMHAAAVARLRLETDLHRALERGEFRLAYQPVVALATGRVAGFEALIRWDHPERGCVSPAEFIPVAEETGMILAIDRWVLLAACRQLQLWQTQYHRDTPLIVSVNLSGKQVLQPDLIPCLDGVLRATGVDPRGLRVEITESAIMGRADAAALALRQLKARGVTLSMDDFGTGYSSLSYLHRFPFDVLKIDRSFVSRIGPGGEGAEIAATVVSLAKQMGMSVVAEGVETLAQCQRLRALGCPYGQGYWFSPPMSIREAEELLAADRAYPIDPPTNPQLALELVGVA